MSKRKTAVFRAFCFFTAVFAVTMMQQSKIFAQEYNVTPAAPGTLEDYDTLLAENRKLAVALAETTESLLKMRAAGANCEGMAELQQQNESLRETIKAQNEVLAAGGGGGCAGMAELQKENQMLQGLKETISELRAQNDHLSTAGNMGHTVTSQVLALQDKIKELKADAEKERQNTAAYREKFKEYEKTIVELKEGQPYQMATADFDAERLALNKEITALKLENQELKARINLANEKAR